MKNLNLVELSSNELNTVNGGVTILPVIGGAIIWCLWEIFDSPEDFKKGVRDGVK